MLVKEDLLCLYILYIIYNGIYIHVIDMLYLTKAQSYFLLLYHNGLQLREILHLGDVL